MLAGWKSAGRAQQPSLLDDGPSMVPPPSSSSRSEMFGARGWGSFEDDVSDTVPNPVRPGILGDEWIGSRQGALPMRGRDFGYPGEGMAGPPGLRPPMFMGPGGYGRMPGPDHAPSWMREPYGYGRGGFGGPGPMMGPPGGPIPLFGGGGGGPMRDRWDGTDRSRAPYDRPERKRAEDHEGIVKELNPNFDEEVIVKLKLHGELFCVILN